MSGPVPRPLRESADSRPEGEPEVLVVGAGPVGLFSALHLARAGVRPVVIDEAPRPAARSYALALHARTLALLDEVGLGQEIARRGHPVTRLAFYEESECRARIALDGGEAEGGPAHGLVVIPQQVLEGLLESTLREQGVMVLWRHRLAALDPAPDDGVPLATVERAGQRPLVLTPQFVVGADGHRSAVRRALGLELAEVGPAELFAIFEITTPPLGVDEDSEARVLLAPGATSVLWPITPGRLRWSFQISSWEGFVEPRFKSRTFLEMGHDPFPYLVNAKLDELLAERAPWFRDRDHEVVWSMAASFERRLAVRFGRGRVWLAGEAARLAGPVGVQSMNVGLREGRDLARRLARVLAGDATAGLLESYGRERRAEWLGLLTGEATAASHAAPWVRRQAARLPAVLPASGRDLAALLAELGLHLTPGPH
jgi:NADPH-dependent dioxygenase